MAAVLKSPVAKLRFVIFVVAIIALAVLLGKLYEARRQLRSQSASLQEQFRRLEDLEAENTRLSNIVARASTPLSEVQLAELQQLRAEVESLRNRTNEIAALRAELTRLRGVLSQAGGSSAAGPPDVPAEDIYPRDSWEFAGYDTPENAIESLMWAVSQGDQDTYAAGLTPELQDDLQDDLANGSFATDAPLEMGDITGYRIVDRNVISDGEVTITVYVDGDGDLMPIVLDKTDNGWAIAATGSP